MERAKPKKDVSDRSAYWRDRIAAQERSGIPVARFCKAHRLTEQAFYYWRKRLRNEQPVRFALVQAGGVDVSPAADRTLELILSTGERLRIGADVSANALRTVLQALRR